MLINAVIYTFPADKADDVARILVELAGKTRAEPGCLGFEVNRSNDDARAFVLYEKWADQTALDAHYASEHFIALGVNGIRPLAESRLAYKCTPLTA